MCLGRRCRVVHQPRVVQTLTYQMHRPARVARRTALGCFAKACVVVSFHSLCHQGTMSNPLREVYSVARVCLERFDRFDRLKFQLDITFLKTIHTVAFVTHGDSPSSNHIRGSLITISSRHSRIRPNLRTAEFMILDMLHLGLSDKGPPLLTEHSQNMSQKASQNISLLASCLSFFLLENMRKYVK